MSSTTLQIPHSEFYVNIIYSTTTLITLYQFGFENDPRLIIKIVNAMRCFLPAEQPPHEADGVLALVVAGDGDVQVARLIVNVGEADDRDVGVGALGDGLVVGPGVGHDQKPRLAEGRLKSGIRMISTFLHESL